MHKSNWASTILRRLWRASDKQKSTKWSYELRLFFSFSLSHIFDSCTHIWIGISNSCSGPIGKLWERARDLFDLASHSIFFWRPHTNTHSDRRAVSYNVHYYSIENEFFNSAKLIQKFARFNNEQQLHERERAKKRVSYSYIAFGYFVVWEHYRCELVEIQNDETTEKNAKITQIYINFIDIYDSSFLSLVLDSSHEIAWSWNELLINSSSSITLKAIHIKRNHYGCRRMRQHQPININSYSDWFYDILSASILQ